MNKHSGFTLIELVIVIAVLAILAAFALPRFANLSSQARISTMQGLAGTLNSAAGIAHAACVAGLPADSSSTAGSCSTSGTSSVLLDGSKVSMTNGYPDTAGIAEAADISSQFSDNAGVFTFSNGSNSGCSVKYDTSTTPPTVDTSNLTSTNC